MIWKKEFDGFTATYAYNKYVKWFSFKKQDNYIAGLNTDQVVELCVKKYDFLAEVFSSKDMTDIPSIELKGVGGPQACPLCHRFINQVDNCKGCPVREKTGKSFCEGSPYDELVVHLNNASYFGRFNAKAIAAACQDEAEFLRSLLCKKVTE